MAAIERTAPQSTFRTVEGVEMHAVTAGAGPTIVLLHPEPGDASTFAAVIPRLADEYRVLALDLRGHGASAKPRGDYSVATQAVVRHALPRRSGKPGGSCSSGTATARSSPCTSPRTRPSGSGHWCCRERARTATITCRGERACLSSWVGRLLAPVVPLPRRSARVPGAIRRPVSA